jgi:dienelactone hydrolase
VRVLYPARVPAQGARMPYAAEEVFAATGGWPAGLRPQGHAWRDAPPAVSKPAPVILFSPGLTASAEMYAGLTEDLASLGYVVVTVNHPYISGPTALPGGGLAVPDPDLEGSDELIEITLADMRTVLAWLERQNGTAGALLGGKLDLNRIGAYGHSFGGATALQLERQDPRVKAAVDLDGSVYGDRTKSWTKPWMILQGIHRYEGQLIDDYTVREMWDNRAGPAVLEVLPEACHGDFGDVPRLVDAYVARTPGATDPLLAEPELYCAADPAAVERDVRRKVRAFFARYLP